MIGLYFFIALDYQAAPEMKLLLEPKFGLDTFFDVIIRADAFEYLEGRADTLDIEHDRRGLKQAALHLAQESLDDPELDGFCAALFTIRDLLNFFN